jgi:hypothetical protein
MTSGFAHFDSQAFARVLVQNAQQLQRPAVGQLVMHEIVRPYTIGRSRAGNADIAATGALPGASLRQVQSKLAPQPPYMAYLCIRHHGDAAIANAGITA